MEDSSLDCCFSGNCYHARGRGGSRLIAPQLSCSESMNQDVKRVSLAEVDQLSLVASNPYLSAIRAIFVSLVTDKIASPRGQLEDWRSC